MKIKVKKFSSYFNNAFSVNTYIVSYENECVIIDLGVFTKEIKDYIKDKKVLAVLLTHGHIDHINGLKDTSFLVYISKADEELLYDGNKNFATNLQMPNVIINNLVFNYLDKVSFFSDFNIIKTPGHTKGSVCIKVQNYCFTGDTLFYDSVGRTDLYGGSSSELFKSIKGLATHLSNDTIICPGHDQGGKFGNLKKVNAYLL